MTKEEIVQYMAEKDAYYFGSADFNRKVKEFNEQEALMEIEIIKEIKSSGLDLKKIANEAWVIHMENLHRKVDENRKKYEAQKIANKEKGEKLKEGIQPGDLIKVRGTNDGRGHRLVMEKKEWEVVCRKLSWSNHHKKFTKDEYITTHGWDKVDKIIATKPEVEKLDLILE